MNSKSASGCDDGGVPIGLVSREQSTGLCEAFGSDDSDDETSDGVRSTRLLWEYISKDESDFLFNEIFVEKSYFKHGISLDCSILSSLSSSNSINTSRTSPIVVDCGANIGLFSLYCHKIYPDVRVIAIEPIPFICEVLARNLYHNKVRHLIVRCALGSSRELESVAEDFSGTFKAVKPATESSSASASSLTTTLSYFPGMPGESSRHLSEQASRLQAVKDAFSKFISNAEIRGDNELGKIDEDSSAAELKDMIKSLEDSYSSCIPVVCPLRSLSSVLAECESFINCDGSSMHVDEEVDIDLIKIDVEGSELLVLQGLDDRWWRRIRQLVAEVYDIDGRLSAVIDLLKVRGFGLINVEASSVEMSETAEGNSYLRFTPPESKLFFVYAIKKL